MPLTFRLYCSYMIISYEKLKHSVLFCVRGGSFLLRATIRELETHSVSNGTQVYNGTYSYLPSQNPR